MVVGVVVVVVVVVAAVAGAEPRITTLEAVSLGSLGARTVRCNGASQGARTSGCPHSSGPSCRLSRPPPHNIGVVLRPQSWSISGPADRGNPSPSHLGAPGLRGRLSSCPTCKSERASASEGKNKRLSLASIVRSAVTALGPTTIKVSLTKHVTQRKQAMVYMDRENAAMVHLKQPWSQAPSRRKHIRSKALIEIPNEPDIPVENSKSSNMFMAPQPPAENSSIIHIPSHLATL